MKILIRQDEYEIYEVTQSHPLQEDINLVYQTNDVSALKRYVENNNVQFNPDEFNDILVQGGE